MTERATSRPPNRVAKIEVRGRGRGQEDYAGGEPLPSLGGQESDNRGRRDQRQRQERVGVPDGRQDHVHGPSDPDPVQEERPRRLAEDPDREGPGGQPDHHPQQSGQRVGQPDGIDPRARRHEPRHQWMPHSGGMHLEGRPK